jgi:hypothetical protein
MYSPKSRPKPKIPEALKREVTTRCNALIEEVLEPNRIVPQPPDMQVNYVVALYTKWWRSYLYFCATYRCPAPNCISEFFDLKFTRLEYAGGDRFHLAYMRHNDKWAEVFTDLTLDGCLELIEGNELFWP